MRGPKIELKSGHSGLFVATLAFCVVITARWWLIRTYSSTIPYGDQWDGEAWDIYIPWVHGHLDWRRLFAAHNEHRILFTHLLNLGLFALNNGWDPQLQTVVNAAWAALITALLVYWVWRGFKPGQRACAVLLIVVLGVAPFAWENTLWGFQSQHYFAILLPLAAVLLLEKNPAFSPAWWLAIACCGLTLLASGAGPISTTSLAVALTVYCYLARTSIRVAIPTVGALIAVAMVGVSIATKVAAHESLHPKTWGTFLKVAALCLAWPNLDFPVVALLAWAPMIAWVLIALRRRNLDPKALLPLTLAFLAITQGLSVAYARGEGLYEGRPLSRYQDLLAFGTIANALALFYLREGANEMVKFKRYWMGLALVWALTAAIGLAELTAINFRLHLPFRKLRNTWAEANVGTYAATKNPAVLAGKTVYELSHPSAHAIQQVIDDEAFFPYLPTPLSRETATPRRLEGLARTALSISPYAFGISWGALLTCLAVSVTGTKASRTGERPHP